MKKSILLLTSLFFLLSSYEAQANFWDKDYDQKTGDIIDKEMDEYGEMRDCTRGKSSNKRKLPSCNDIIDRRQNYYEDRNKKSNQLFTERLKGSNIFVLPNNSKIKGPPLKRTIPQ